MYEYKATVDAVIDGDTIDVDIDLGFRVATNQRVRLRGVDTPEMNSSDPAKRAKAQEAKAFVVKWLESWAGEGRVVLIRSHKPGGGDKYGRFLADVIAPGGRSLATDLIAEGHAVAYDGGAKSP